MITLVSKQHVGRIIGLAFLAADKLLSVSQDGAIGLWTVSRCALTFANTCTVSAKCEALTKIVYCALTACKCRDAPASVAVQLIRMEYTPLPATCMTSSADKSLAAVGLSSGQILLVSVNSQTKPGLTLAESGSTVTVSYTESGDRFAEPASSSNAALAVVTLCEQHEAAVTSAQLSSDCGNLATISSDGAVFVWDTFARSDADLYVASRTTIAGASCATWLPGKRLLVGCISHQLVVSPYTSDQHFCVVPQSCLVPYIPLTKDMHIYFTEDL